MNKFSWKQAPDLMARLTKAQNHPTNIRQDIMTFAGMCDSREELQAHVERYEARTDDEYETECLRRECGHDDFLAA